ncbi:MAG TPA: glycosyltransferase [Bacteroidales bacterium]|nr:glycosyltransferase [Bacteroidales bacterium]
MKKAIVSVINDLVTDQRVNKSCLVLQELGYEVLLVGRRRKRSLPLPSRPYAMHRMRLLFEHGPLFYACYNVLLFFVLLWRHADLLFANDLDTLLPNYLISKIKNIPIVYDSHEYFTETPELVNRKFVQDVWKKIEATLLPRIKTVITVNDSIAKLFREKYHKEIHVVRNIPPQQKDASAPAPVSLKLANDKPMVLLQGSGINIQRGAEELVEAMQYVQRGQLLIIGGGDVIGQLKQMTLDLQLTDRITFMPPMPFEKLRSYTRLATIGLSIDKDTNINYRYSLPNKLFDYIHAGVPVMVSPLTEIKKIVDKWQVGEIISSHEPRSIALHIDAMLTDTEKLQLYRQNCLAAAKALNWENEKQVLIKILKQYV